MQWCSEKHYMTPRNRWAHRQQREVRWRIRSRCFSLSPRALTQSCCPAPKLKHPIDVRPTSLISKSASRSETLPWSEYNPAIGFFFSFFLWAKMHFTQNNWIKTKYFHAFLGLHTEDAQHKRPSRASVTTPAGLFWKPGVGNRSVVSHLFFFCYLLEKL